MSVVYLDFETYFDKVYSLKKMSVPAYVKDPRFQILMVSYAIDGGPVQNASGDAAVLQALRDAIDGETTVVAHNACFEGAILEWVLGIKPKAYFCTMMASRPYVAPFTGSMSAASVSEFLNGPRKLDMPDMAGLRREQIDGETMLRLMLYCDNDVEIARYAHQYFHGRMPADEEYMVGLHVEKFVRPRLRINPDRLDEMAEGIKDEQAKMLLALPSDVTPEILRSNVKFADALGRRGVTAPVKVSVATGNITFAMAKKDPDFMALAAHPNHEVRLLLRARQAFKSSIDLTRATAFKKIAEVMDGYLPVPLLYYGAHTGRAAGWQGVNMQNLPKKSGIRDALVAPPGYTIIVVDLSQIEARITAVLSGQWDLVAEFSGDPYSVFASEIYGIPVTKGDPATEKERFVGKTCLAEGTLVLCDSGWKPIETVTLEDRVWDGVEWVEHCGLSPNGLKETQQLSGVWLTPDHDLWSGTQWLPAQQAIDDPLILSQLLATGAESLPLQATCLPTQGGVFEQSSLHVDAACLSTQSTRTTSGILNPHAAIAALRKRLVRSGTGYTLTPCQTTNIGDGCLTDSLLLSHGATARHANSSLTMVDEGSLFTSSGEPTELRSCDTSRRSQDGTTHPSRWIASTTAEATPQETCDSQPGRQTSETNARSQNLRRRLPVYDLLSAGPRHRFTILTADGPVIASNCILGLGFGMSAPKLQLTLAGYGVDLSIEECTRIVKLYRSKYSCIPALWRQMDIINHTMTTIGTGQFSFGCLTVEKNRICLPNGMAINYPELRREADKSFSYLGWQGKASFRKFLWGGATTENVVQALARIIIARAEVRLAKAGLKSVLQVHDELVYVVPDAAVERVKLAVNKVLTDPVPWMPRLPIACSVGTGKSYGQAK